VNGLDQWRQLLESDVRDKKVALARMRLAVERAEAVEALLAGERERRDQHERERRAQGEMPDFARERLNVLLERALVRARGKVADARVAAEDAAERLRVAWRRVTLLDRLLERRRERARLEGARRDQRERDELASIRHAARTREEARTNHAPRLQTAGDGVPR
jgi:flagellar export protein FliJ